MKTSQERRMRQVIKRWEAGCTLTAAERRQIRKMAGVPRAVPDARRVTYDESHPAEVTLYYSHAVNKKWEALGNEGRSTYTDKRHFADCESQLELAELHKQQEKTK